MSFVKTGEIFVFGVWSASEMFTIVRDGCCWYMVVQVLNLFWVMMVEGDFRNSKCESGIGQDGVQHILLTLRRFGRSLQGIVHKRCPLFPGTIRGNPVRRATR